MSRSAAFTIVALLAVQCIANLPAAKAGGGGGGRPCRRRCRSASGVLSSSKGGYLKVAALNIATVSNADGPFTAEHIQECLSRAVVTLSNVKISSKAPADATTAAVAQDQALAHELGRVSQTEEGLTVYVAEDVEVAASSVESATAQLYSDVAQAATTLGNVKSCAAQSNAEFKFVATLNQIVNFNQPDDACTDLEGAHIKGSFKRGDVAAQSQTSWKVYVASTTTCA